MNSKIVFGIILGIALIGILASKVDAFFWLGGCGPCNGPTVPVVTPPSTTHVTPADFGERCAKAGLSRNECKQYCRWQGVNRDWDSTDIGDCDAAAASNQ